MREQIRAELADTASALFHERGFDATTVDDIVNSVGVSRRTFFRYFASKEDAVLQPVEAIGPSIGRELAARPTGETPALALRRSLDVLVHDFAEREPRWRSVLRLNRNNPSLRARHLTKQDEWRAVIAAALSTRMESGPKDTLPVLYSGLALAAVDASLLAVDDLPMKSDLGPLIDESFDQIGTFGVGLHLGSTGRHP
jgi:AcrR family transcriptional regulator